MITMKPLASRMGHLAPHFFASLNARLAALQTAGQDVIRLDEGAPDLPPPPAVIEALQRAAARPTAHSYQPHRGPATLRRAWADSYQRQHGLMLDPDQEITPLLGSKEGIFHLSQALIEPGDVALVPDPGYITYTRGAQMAGGEAVYLPLRRERGWLPDLDAIPTETLRRAKLMWLNYPNNPTAAVASREFFARAVALAHEYGFWLAHDAAYGQVTFDGYHPPSLLQIPGALEVAVEFNTLSKSHNMAGWRSGALLGSRRLVQALYVLKTNADSGHFLPILEASTVALEVDPDWIAARNAVYQTRRDAVLAGLHRMGLPVDTPRASLYVWTPVPAGYDELSFVTQALEQVGVSLTPGTVFGPSGQGYVRIALTAPLERVEEAMRRLEGLCCVS